MDLNRWLARIRSHFYLQLDHIFASFLHKENWINTYPLLSQVNIITPHATYKRISTITDHKWFYTCIQNQNTCHHYAVTFLRDSGANNKRNIRQSKRNKKVSIDAVIYSLETTNSEESLQS